MSNPHAGKRLRVFRNLLGWVVTSLRRVCDSAMIINTLRVRLRCWEQADRDAFATMHADPEVMHDYGGPISRSESDAEASTATQSHTVNMASKLGGRKRRRWLSWLRQHRAQSTPPCNPSVHISSIGWRLVRHVWVPWVCYEMLPRAALSDAFIRVPFVKSSPLPPRTI